MIADRKFIVRIRDRGRPAWHFVLLDDDVEKIWDFIDKTQGENRGKFSLNLSNYGQVLKSGWEKDPSPEDQKWIDNYGHP